jgi:hypothetical protein
MFVLLKAVIKDLVSLPEKTHYLPKGEENSISNNQESSVKVF